MSSKETRRRLANLSFAEKIKLLEKLRCRSEAIAESRRRMLAKLQDPRPKP